MQICHGCTARMRLRLIAVLVGGCFLLTQSGCTVEVPPSLLLHGYLNDSTFAVIPAHTEVPLPLKAFEQGKPVGVWQGAGQGAADAVGGLRGANCSGELCGVALLVLLTGAVVVGGTVGAIRGAMNDGKEVGRLAGELERQEPAFSAHLDLSGRVLDEMARQSAPPAVLVDLGHELAREDYAQLLATGYSKALTVQVTKLDTVSGKGEDPNLALLIEAEVRIIDLPYDEVLYRRSFRRLGTPQRYSSWVALPATALVKRLDDDLRQLAADIVYTLFIAYDLPIPSGTWAFPGSASYGCCWLCPVTPKQSLDYFPSPQQEWVTVDSLQPTLAWETFPGATRQARLIEEAGSPAERVSYDLKIWQYRGSQLGTLIYERYGLGEPQHTLETPLAPEARYLWSFRACFDLGARSVCTPWAFSLVPTLPPDYCDTPIVRADSYYRFMTPSLPSAP